MSGQDGMERGETEACAAAYVPGSEPKAAARTLPPLRLSLVTLGVADLKRAVAFYEALGLERRVKDATGAAFFDAGGVVLSLYPRTELAADAGVLAGRPGAFGGIALACNRAT